MFPNTRSLCLRQRAAAAASWLGSFGGAAMKIRRRIANWANVKPKLCRGEQAERNKSVLFAKVKAFPLGAAHFFHHIDTEKKKKALGNLTASCLLLVIMLMFSN